MTKTLSTKQVLNSVVKSLEAWQVCCLPSHAYPMFLTAAPLIELLGAHHDDKGFDEERLACKRFSFGIIEYFDNKEYWKYVLPKEDFKQDGSKKKDPKGNIRALKFDLYRGYRCGMLHRLASKDGIEIMQKDDLRKKRYANLPTHLVPGEKDGLWVLPLHLEDLIADLRKAIDKLEANWDNVLKSVSKEKGNKIEGYLRP